MAMVDINRAFLFVLVVALIGVVIVLGTEDLVAEIVGLLMAVGGALWLYKER